jgi:hypothetical protein
MPELAAIDNPAGPAVRLWSRGRGVPMLVRSARHSSVAGRAARARRGLYRAVVETTLSADRQAAPGRYPDALGLLVTGQIMPSTRIPRTRSAARAIR